MFEYFLYCYGDTIFTAILCAIGGCAAYIVNKFLNTETKRKIAKAAMLCVEQVWKELHGEDKMNKALEYAEKELAKKGIKFDADEMKLFIEAALCEFNKVYNKFEIES